MYIRSKVKGKKERYEKVDVYKRQYLDYDYIAAMQDIGKRGKIKAQEILDGLERKGYAEEDFLGNLEVEPACTEMLQPVYQGMYESCLLYTSIL